jgi:serine/threonine-protein kinase
MASVYLARTRVVDDLYREVAVKLMHPHLRTEDGCWAAQLVEEAKLAASIRHPNVVPVHEVGDDAHGVFLVMEYVEGDTLAGVIRAARQQKAALPPPIVARILADALTGLHAAHELTGPTGQPLRLVHRDFSPQNVLVGTDGISRLTDFGIAKVTTRVGATASGVIKGKVGYMAPEQALGRPLDRRCDVWAAGVVAWELLAMRRLFADENEVATLLRLVSEQPPSIRSACPNVSRQVEAAISSALQVDPDKRCPSALDLRARVIDAWSVMGPIADAVEVSAFVQGLVGAKLDKRKEQVRDVLALRSKISRVSERAIAAASSDGFDSGSPPGTPDPSLGATSYSESTDMSVALPRASHGLAAAPSGAEATKEQRSSRATSPNARPWARPWIGISLVVVVVVAGLGLLARHSSIDDRERGSAIPTEPATPTASTLSRREATPSASPEVRPTPGRLTLIVRSEMPISGLLVGQRAVALVSPSREVDVQLADDERTADLEITATARDGRRRTLRVRAPEHSVEVVFPAVARARTSAPTKPLGLAPTPYEDNN